MVKVSPSILAADFSNLEREIRKVERCADYIHLDVMDGHFVPNLSFGYPVVKAIRKISNIPIDVHLMVSNPEHHVEGFAQFNPEIVIVHYEVCNNLYRTLQRIRELGSKAFVAVNPHTPVFVLDDIVEYLDGVLVMSVNPGFSGQKFIRRSVHKVKMLNEMRKARNLDYEIMVDGGVSPSNAADLVEAGADILVMGSAVFKEKNADLVCKKVKEYSNQF
jgi:ribulose-phosphate 3-epimerase